MPVTVWTGNYTSGKSTALRHRAEELRAAGREAIEVDYDTLAVALGSTKTHGHSDPISAVTVRVRGLAIKAALDAARDFDVDVLIVDASPTEQRLKQYRDAAAEIVALDVPLDELHRRADAERPPEWHDYIDEWTPVRQPSQRQRKPWPKRPAHAKGMNSRAYQRLRAAFLADKTNCARCGVPFRTDAPCNHRVCAGNGCHFDKAYPSIGHVVRLGEGGKLLDTSTWEPQCLGCNTADGGRFAARLRRSRAEAETRNDVDLDW